jgi:integrase/recombinase XerD
MNRALEDHLAQFEARGYSVSRLTHVRRTTEMLILYLRETHSVGDWRAVSESQLKEFVIYAASRHRTPKGNSVSPATVRQWVSGLRSFFAWMRQTGRMVHDPSEELVWPRKGQSLPHVLSENEIDRLIELPDTGATLGIRDRALMETLYATGIRHAEAHKLDLYDVDTARGLLIVRQGKGKRDRIVPLTEAASYWLARYITDARPELATGKKKGRRSKTKEVQPPAPTTALWLAVSGRRLSYQMLAQRIHDYADQAELKATVHSFRHCCATHLLRGGASLRHVQQLLGHTSLNSTEIYTHVEIEDLKRAVEQASENG